MPTPLDLVNTRIQQACDKSGRSPQDVTLVAVSKTWPAEIVELLVAEGQSIFGENKLQELETKAPALAGHLQWHFIGGLQRNKVRKILQHSEVIHSVDSKKLLDTIDRIAGEESINPSVFFQVNLEGEKSKGGLTPEETEELVIHAQSLTHVKLIGLMSIPKFYTNPEDVRPSFRKLRELRDEIVAKTGSPLPSLSMGMSHDYEVAVEEGATHIRVGSALFGSRNYPT